MNKPYHERPDWILKAICYYCDNYILNGQDLRKFKRGAIAQYKNGDQVALPGAFVWTGIDYFWQSIAWLMGCAWGSIRTAKVGAPSCGVTCKPWTNYEKRKIAKMPEVK